MFSASMKTGSSTCSKNPDVATDADLSSELFAHPKEVNELAESVGAYRTDVNNVFSE